jgi:hypothetical protein
MLMHDQELQKLLTLPIIFSLRRRDIAELLFLSHLINIFNIDKILNLFFPEYKDKLNSVFQNKCLKITHELHLLPTMQTISNFIQLRFTIVNHTETGRRRVPVKIRQWVKLFQNLTSQFATVFGL